MPRSSASCTACTIVPTPFAGEYRPITITRNGPSSRSPDRSGKLSTSIACPTVTSFFDPPGNVPCPTVTTFVHRSSAVRTTRSIFQCDHHMTSGMPDGRTSGATMIA